MLRLRLLPLGTMHEHKIQLKTWELGDVLYQILMNTKNVHNINI